MKVFFTVFILILMLSAVSVAETDIKTNFEQDLELAKLGNAGGQFRTGARFLNGNGVEIDYEKAFMWLNKAAAQNHSNALYNLGYMYLYGVGIDIDFKKAAEYFEKSKKGGFMPAAYILCIMHYDGAGVSKDIKEAYKNCKIAADSGYAPAGEIMDNATMSIIPYQDNKSAVAP